MRYIPLGTLARLHIHGSNPATNCKSMLPGNATNASATLILIKLSNVTKHRWMKRLNVLESRSIVRHA